MSQSKNWSLTINNPKENLTEFFDKLKYKSESCRVQLEKGEEGTPHFQACVTYKANKRIARVIKDFSGAHVTVSRSAMAAWTYCGKEDSRVEGPMQHGFPPAAKNVAGDTAARNKMLIEYGAAKAVDEGLISVTQFKSVK